MRQIPDDPMIRRAEATGYNREPVWPICPVCGQECDTLVKRGDEIVGCGNCIHTADAWEAPECFPDKE